MCDPNMQNITSLHGLNMQLRMRRADGQQKQTTEHSKDTLYFDKTADMQVAIRYQLRCVYA